MRISDHTQMHRDHQEWRNLHALWHIDLLNWRSGIEGARKGIHQLEMALADHAKALEAHSQALRDSEVQITRHEKALADFERGGKGEPLIEMALSHGEQAKSQNQMQQAHLRIKRHHHEILAQWNELLKSIAEAM